MDSWALETGSPHPPLTPGKLRLYSMRFCPYAQRTLLVLKAKAIDHEVVNVNLRERPEWYYDVLPAGTVPVLYQDDKVISGSMPIIEYLEEVYPEPALMPSDPYLKALDRSFLDSASSERDDIRPCRQRHGGWLSPLNGQIPQDKWSTLAPRTAAMYARKAQYWAHRPNKVCRTGLRNRDPTSRFE
ncbi:hypothetical protein HPB48_011720 [Haemaphysalis longicornis]|uniref:GST N-terminal domain-containing protein n=1 Tax=Haemaphysalis longicornis TaxID=44386 RepID=A0A9J6H2G1_HAELO|nr:hypothetical protein HPB48_011720 [Haemaphysalis longicornis]